MWQKERHGGFEDGQLLPQLVSAEQLDATKPKPIWGTTIYAFTSLENGRYSLKKFDFSVKEEGDNKQYIFTKCDCGDDQGSCTQEEPECYA